MEPSQTENQVKRNAERKKNARLSLLAQHPERRTLKRRPEKGSVIRAGQREAAVGLLPPCRFVMYMERPQRGGDPVRLPTSLENRSSFHPPGVDITKSDELGFGFSVRGGRDEARHPEDWVPRT